MISYNSVDSSQKSEAVDALNMKKESIDKVSSLEASEPKIMPANIQKALATKAKGRLIRMDSVSRQSIMKESEGTGSPFKSSSSSINKNGSGSPSPSKFNNKDRKLIQLHRTVSESESVSVEATNSKNGAGWGESRAVGSGVARDSLSEMYNEETTFQRTGERSRTEESLQDLGSVTVKDIQVRDGEFVEVIKDKVDGQNEVNDHKNRTQEEKERLSSKNLRSSIIKSSEELDSSIHEVDIRTEEGQQMLIEKTSTAIQKYQDGEDFQPYKSTHGFKSYGKQSKDSSNILNLNKNTQSQDKISSHHTKPITIDYSKTVDSKRADPLMNNQLRVDTEKKNVRIDPSVGNDVALPNDQEKEYSKVDHINPFKGEYTNPIIANKNDNSDPKPQQSTLKMVDNPQKDHSKRLINPIKQGKVDNEYKEEINPKITIIDYNKKSEEIKHPIMEDGADQDWLQKINTLSKDSYRNKEPSNNYSQEDSSYYQDNAESNQDTPSKMHESRTNNVQPVKLSMKEIAEFKGDIPRSIIKYNATGKVGLDQSRDYFDSYEDSLGKFMKDTSQKNEMSQFRPKHINSPVRNEKEKKSKTKEKKKRKGEEPEDKKEKKAFRPPGHKVIKPNNDMLSKMKEQNLLLFQDFKETLYHSEAYQHDIISKFEKEKQKKMEYIKEVSKNIREEDMIDEILASPPLHENLMILRSRVTDQNS